MAPRSYLLVVLASTCNLGLLLPNAAYGQASPSEVGAEQAGPQQRVLFVGASGLDAGRWGLAYDRLFLGASTPGMRGWVMRGEAAASFTAVRIEAESEKAEANGVAAWLGMAIGWSGTGVVDKTALSFDVLVAAAPLITILEEDARRLSILFRPGIAMQYGWFAFTFGMNMEVVLNQTKDGPWSVAADEPPIFLPGANIGLGVTF